MRYEKPMFKHYISIPQCIWAFLDSLPDSFEIVPEGHVCVKWPDGLTREALDSAADSVEARVISQGSERAIMALRRLAALARGAPKKKLLCLWSNGCGKYEALGPNETPAGYGVWRSVQTIEVED